jgi:type I restriction enzyme S subunit
VRYLNEIDRHIARFIRNRRRLIEVLNEQKQAIINRAVTRGLDPNAPLKPSGVDWLGDIPEHWEVCPLCSFAQPKSITNCPERELLSVYLDKGVIRFSDVSEKRTNPTSNDLSNYQAVDPGDFVLNNQQAWRGSVGVSQYTGIVSPAYLVLALNPNMESRFADYLLRGKAMVAQYLVSSKGVGSIQRNLYWPHLKRVIAPVPPHREQADTVKHLDRATRGIDKAIGRTQKEIDLIREYRTRLIADVVTGKVDVRDLAPPPGSDELEETVDELEPLDDAEGELEEDALAGEVAHAED